MLLSMLELLNRERGLEDGFYTSVEPENIIAQKLYMGLGFQKTGEVMWDEEVMVVQL